MGGLTDDRGMDSGYFDESKATKTAGDRSAIVTTKWFFVFQMGENFANLAVRVDPGRIRKR
jgi:hypothetical protein